MRFLIFTLGCVLASTPVSAATYYLNDGSTVGDVYTTTTGLDNAGRNGSASQPYASLQFLYAQQDLDGGDTVLLDAGTFDRATMLNNGAGTNDDGGSVGNFLVLRGAGTSLTTISNSVTAGDVLFFEDTEYVIVYQMTLTSVNGRNNDAVACWINASNIIVAECNLNHQDVAGTAGAVQWLGPNCCVAHCTINSQGWGIYLGADGHHIFDNAINCNGNTSYANAAGIKILNSDNDSIFANRITGVAGTSYGFEVVNTSTNNYIISNYVSRFDNGVFTATNEPNNFLYNNSFYVDQTVLFQAFNGWDIRNNILYTISTNTGHYCGHNTLAANFPGTLNYNIYYHPSGARAWQDFATTYNTFALLQAGKSVEANGINANPNYTSPGTGDLSISAGSPAESTGQVIGVVSFDVQPKVRPGTNREIGAFEIDAVGGLDDLHGLPVEWSEVFAEVNKDGTVNIRWGTLSETDNAVFNVLWSQNGVDYINIGTTYGAGTSSTINFYNFEHANPVSGTNYYKIQQVDFDGSFSNSKTVSISLAYSSMEIVRSGSGAQLIADMQTAQQVFITILSIDGKVLQHFNPNLNAGHSSFRIPLDNLSSMVIVKATCAEGSVSEKIVPYAP